MGLYYCPWGPSFIGRDNCWEVKEGKSPVVYLVSAQPAFHRTWGSFHGEISLLGRGFSPMACLVRVHTSHSIRPGFEFQPGHFSVLYLVSTIASSWLCPLEAPSNLSHACLWDGYVKRLSTRFLRARIPRLQAVSLRPTARLSEQGEWGGDAAPSSLNTAGNFDGREPTSPFLPHLLKALYIFTF